jgi:hypothetical protein
LTVLRRRVFPLVFLALFGLLLASCGGNAKGGDNDVVRIDGPDLPEPSRIAIQTLEPGPTPTPTPEPTPTPVPTPTPPGVPAPKSASLTAATGTQKGSAEPPSCWSEQVGGPSSCNDAAAPAPATSLSVKQKEKVLLRIDAKIPPDGESIRPFQGTRSGYPDNPIDPALETELTIDLPKGEWSMDLCGSWDGRGQLCWLFKVNVT